MPAATHRRSNGTTAVADLCRILDIRLIMLAICMAALQLAAHGLGLALPLGHLTILIGFAFAVSALWRWHVGRQARPAGPHAMTAQLLLDIGILTAILYLTGGWTNPLVSLYLIPIAVAATVLPRTTTWMVAGAAALAYTAMTRFFQPIFDLHHGGADFALHVSGMWLTFVIAAALLAYFGTRFTETLRNRDRALAEAREANLRNEQIIGVATLAAGTAHELSTPLATIAVIAAELEATAGPEIGQDLAELSRQVTVCREILKRLRSAANPEVVRRSSREFLAEVAERFRLLRPAVPLQTKLPEAAVDRPLDADPVLHQALLNLLDNAANVSPGGIELIGRATDEQLEIQILDRGPGFDAQGPATAGLGMGLVLTNTTIERRGGSVFATSRTSGGTCVRVILPLSEPASAGP
jgi:two-component system, sensor histidine kinase RegB